MSDRDELLPARFVQAFMSDPAAGVPGAPPGFGQTNLPHIETQQARYGGASHIYMNYDEATAHSRLNAEKMRTHCMIMECLEARQRAVALLKWHVEAPNERDESQKDLAAKMEAILGETPYFTELRRSTLDAIWYGRQGMALQHGAEYIDGNWRTVVKHAEPRHGDKLVFRYDPGNYTIDPQQIGIRVGTGYTGVRYKVDPFTKKETRCVEATPHGLVYWLDANERKRIIIHKHMMEDAPFENARFAGRIHGVGIRDRIYWTYYAMIECLQRVLEFLDRASYGIEVWPYPAGNAQALEQTKQAAFAWQGGGRNVIFAPIHPGQEADLYQPRMIEVPMAGVAQVIDIIRTFFGHMIKRYILGQTLSSEADATGMGSEVANAHMATLGDIIAYDAINLEETLTRDLLRPLQHWNFPDSRGVKLKFRIDTEADNVMEKLKALQMAWAMGLKIKAADVAQVIGFAMPSPEDEILQNPTVAQGMAAMKQAMQPQPTNGVNTFDVEGFHQNVLANMRSLAPSLAA